MDPNDQYDLLSEAGATLASREEFVRDWCEVQSRLQNLSILQQDLAIRQSWNISMVIMVGAVSALTVGAFPVLVTAPAVTLLVSDILWGVRHQDEDI